MSDTPETDANTEYDAQDGSPFAPCREWVHANFARRLERERDEARREPEAERHLPTNLLDVDAICKQRDEARQELFKTIEQRDGAFYLIEYAGELLGVKPQEHKSAHGFQVLQAIKDLINKSQ
jgi:hypothetical protein